MNLGLIEKSIVFYDGVNDVAIRCRFEVEGLATNRQHQIRSILGGGFNKYSFRRTFGQLIDFTDSIKKRVVLYGSTDSVSSYYDCHNNPAKAAYVAKSLVNVWIQAKLIAEANGDDFLAILQPVAYIGQPNVDYLELNDKLGNALGLQYESVYPLILKYAKTADLIFHDLTKVYDSCGNCYIDFNHVLCISANKK